MMACLILRYAKVGLKEFVNEIAKDMDKECSKECKENDIPELIEFLKSCNKLDEYFTNEEQLVEIHQFDRQLLYSESLTCCEKILEKNLRCLQTIFRETDVLRDMKTCKYMVEKIKEIENNQFIPGRKEEKRILTELVSELRKRVYILKDKRLKKATVLVDKFEIIDEYECIQKKVREIEDTCHKFRGFINVNKIEEPEIMRKLCSIVTIAREVYFEAGQQKTKHENAPGRPYVVFNKLGQVEVAWEPPSRLMEHGNYEVLIYEGFSEEQKKSIQCKECTVVLENLKGDTDFTFKVRRVVNDDIGPLSITSKMIKTVRPAGLKYLNTGNCYKEGTPTVYTLPMTEDDAFRNQEVNLRRFEIGLPQNHYSEKKILLLGEAGTAVDYILNFALGINLDEGYIFTVNVKDALKTQEQRQSITEYVIYPEEGSRVTHTLSLIDTSALMNCSEIERAENTFQNIQALVNTGVGIRSDSVDAICVIINVNDFQLTGVQRNVVERALALFGNGLTNNICLVATCADRHKQLARTIAKEFNIHEVLYADFDFDSSFSSEAFWDRNLNNFKQFLQFIGKNKTCKFTSPKEVLEYRLRLKEKTALLEKQMNMKNHKEVKLKQEEERKTYINTEVIEKRRKYISEMEETLHIEFGTIGFAETFCINCSHRCHDICIHTIDEDTVHFLEVKCDAHKVIEERKEQYAQTLNRFQVASNTCESLREAINDIDREIDRITNEIDSINLRLTDISLR